MTAPIARETSTQCIPGPAISSDGRTKSPSVVSFLAIPNSGPIEDHVHRQAAAAPLDEELLRRRHHLGGGLARLVRGQERLEAVLVDLHALPHRLELGVALHRSGEVELGVERDEVEAFEGAEVAHGHDVVESVDADPLPAPVAGRGRDVLAGPVVEDLLELRRAVLADVPRLGREDDLRLALRGARRRRRSGGRSGSRRGR